MLEHHLATAEVRKTPAAEARSRSARGSAIATPTGKLSEVTLVHPLEADLADGKLSVESPIGQALLGARAGEQVAARDPPRARSGSTSSRSPEPCGRSAVADTAAPGSRGRSPACRSRRRRRPRTRAASGAPALALDRQLEVGDRAVERVVLGADRVGVDPGDEVARLRARPGRGP